MPKKERDPQFKQLLLLLLKNASNSSIDLKVGKEFLGNLANWAGKGKDEIVQLICREIGTAAAAVMKEPMSQMLSDKKLQLTLELVPKELSQKRKSKVSRNKSEKNPKIKLNAKICPLKSWI